MAVRSKQQGYAKHAKKVKSESAQNGGFTFFFVLVSLFFGSPIQSESVLAQDFNAIKEPVRAHGEPAEVKFLSTPTLIDFSTATRSEIFPGELIEKFDRIQKTKSEELRPLRDCGAALAKNIERTVYYLDRNEPTQAETYLELLVRSTVQWAKLRTAVPSAAKDDDTPSPVYLEEIHLALERYITLWRLAAQADLAPGVPVTGHFDKSVEDVRRLKDKTRDVETYFLGESASKAAVKSKGDDSGRQWCEYLDTRSFLADLEACERSMHAPNRTVSEEASRIPVTMLVPFCDRANVVLARLEDSELSAVQKAYLDTSTIRAWREELQRWQADTVSAVAMLRAVHRYEATGGMSDMEHLFRLATRQSFSPSPALRRLGAYTRELYGLPNVRLFVSKALINNHLPPMKPESGAFRETIQGQPTQGRRQAEPELSIQFVPDESRLRFMLDLDVNVETNSRSTAFATMLFNSGQAQVEAHKEIELTEAGFHLAPCTVRVVHNRLQLRRVQTDFDRVPLLSGLVRSVVKNQYDSKIAGARSETQQKIAAQVRTRLDREAEKRFETINERYRTFLENSMDRFGLFIEQKDAKTEEDWLLTSWAIRSQDTLSGNTPAPVTLPGSFADLKIHESAINMIIGKMNFDGKDGTVGEIRREIAEKFNRPEIDKPGDNDDVPIAFADYNPIALRFVDGKIEIAVSLKSLRIGRKTHRDFKVFVFYEPDIDDDGKLVLKRCPVISLLGCPGIGDQIALRAAFGKIFPEKRLVPLTPKLLEENPEFQYLATGHCRIEKGWVAVALIAKDENDVRFVGRDKGHGQARSASKNHPVRR